MTERFDAAYYRQFYGRQPVHTRAKIARLASGVVGMCGWLGIPMRSVLDIGAGPGYWRDFFATERPGTRYVGIDISAYACAKYGHEHRDITTWRPARSSDLTICQGVLQYPDDAGAERAIETIGAVTRGALYLEVPTSYDRVATIDADHTDLDIHWREGDWYRERLEPHFQQLGAGIWVARSLQFPLYELERAAR